MHGRCAKHEQAIHKWRAHGVNTAHRRAAPANSRAPVASSTDLGVVRKVAQHDQSCDVVVCQDHTRDTFNAYLNKATWCGRQAAVGGTLRGGTTGTRTEAWQPDGGLRRDSHSTLFAWVTIRTRQRASFGAAPSTSWGPDCSPLCIVSLPTRPRAGESAPGSPKCACGLVGPASACPGAQARSGADRSVIHACWTAVA